MSNVDDLTCDYLQRKGVNAYGIKMTPLDGIELPVDLIPPTYTEPDPNDSSGTKKKRYLPAIPPKSLAIPLHDTAGKIYMIQFILDRKANAGTVRQRDTDKYFWPPGGEKKARFYFYGPIPPPGGVILIGEGYATLATAHEATGLPFVVAFDANNIEPVLQELLPYYLHCHFLILADDDDFAQCLSCKTHLQLSQNDPITCPHCEKPHKRKNDGIQQAMRACFDERIRFIKPHFADNDARFQHFKSQKGKLTDFNDLYRVEALLTVRLQILQALEALDWQPWGRGAGYRIKGGGELQPVNLTAECLDRFSLIYGHNQTVFDHYEHKLVSIRDVRDLCQHRDVYTRWQESMNRRIVRIENVGFDPTGRNDQINCNLWRGWPTEPTPGDCQIALDLLEYLCSQQSNAADIYQFTLKWLSFIVRNPGAKMRSALIFHGPQGTGKNLFWENLVMPIFGQYGVLIGQDTLEDKHNTFASAKMLVVADEVVARQDLQHIKNKLKYYVTSATIRINPKNLAAYDEKNLMNFVFMANGILPLIMEDDDRRHGVIWTPEKLSKAFYKDVGNAIKQGLSAHFHHYLLHDVDLTGFDEYTEPPLTDAKQDVIELSRSSIEKFGHEWLDGMIDGMPRTWPVASSDLFETYKIWSRRAGFTPYNISAFTGTIAHLRGIRKTTPRHYVLGAVRRQNRFIVPPKAEQVPEGEAELYWLGECVQKFRDWLENYT